MLTTAELQVHIHCFVNRCMTTKNNKYPGAIPPLLLPAVYTTPTALSSYQAGHKHFTVARLMFMSPCMATTQTAYAMFTWATASSSSRHARVWHTTVRWHKVCKTVEFCADEHCAMLSNEHHAHSWVGSQIILQIQPHSLMHHCCYSIRTAVGRRSEQHIVMLCGVQESRALATCWQALSMFIAHMHQLMHVWICSGGACRAQSNIFSE